MMTETVNNATTAVLTVSIVAPKHHGIVDKVTRRGYGISHLRTEFSIFYVDCCVINVDLKFVILRSSRPSVRRTSEPTLKFSLNIDTDQSI